MNCDRPGVYDCNPKLPGRGKGGRVVAVLLTDWWRLCLKILLIFADELSGLEFQIVVLFHF